MKIHWPAAIGVFLIALAIWLHRTGDYMIERPTTVEVLEKYLPAGGYKSSAAPVMVVRTSDGHPFDMYVSFATYTLYGKGDRLTFNLRRMDIRQTGKDNVLYFFGPVLLVAFGIVSFLWGIGAWWFGRPHNGSSAQENT